MNVCVNNVHHQANLKVQELDMQLLCYWLYKSTQVPIFYPSYRTTEETVVVFHF